MFSDAYPANTVKGRICLNFRLDWDKDKSKETSDIYIKPRLIVIATILTIGCVLFYAIRRVKTFVPKFCASNRTHACIGGRYRRNLLTFDELSNFYTFLIVFYLFDSVLILILYATQDIITQDSVFVIYHTVCISFDLLCVIFLPIYILYKSQSDFPVLWTNYTPKTIKFYTTKTTYIPRRENKSKYKTNKSTNDSTIARMCIPSTSSQGSQARQLDGIRQITESYLTLNVASLARGLVGRESPITEALPRFVQKTKREMQSRNQSVILSRMEKENRWRTKFIQMKMEKKSVSHNQEQSVPLELTVINCA